jgi:hypothetical protein
MLSVARLLIVTAITCTALSHVHSEEKRDLRGFALGMTSADAKALSLKQCINPLCSPQLPQFCKLIDNLNDIKRGGSKYFFESVSSYGSGYTCEFEDDGTVEFTLTPTTGKIFEASAYVHTTMNCGEFLSFVEQEFHVSNPLVDPQAGECEASWAIKKYRLHYFGDKNPGNNRMFRITISDQDLIDENDKAAEKMRQNSLRKPPL